MDILRKCTHCGRTASLRYDEAVHGFFAICHGCGCKTQTAGMASRFGRRTLTAEESKHMAVTDWNTGRGILQPKLKENITRLLIYPDGMILPADGTLRPHSGLILPYNTEVR